MTGELLVDSFPQVHARKMDSHPVALGIVAETVARRSFDGVLETAAKLLTDRVGAMAIDIHIYLAVVAGRVSRYRKQEYSHGEHDCRD
jgi:hypothetical protein